MQPGFAVLRSRQVMKKPDLARDVAKRNGVEKGAAADQMDRVVTRIIRTLRRGQPARLPGLGTLEPGKPWTFRPESYTRSDPQSPPESHPQSDPESHED